MDLKRRNLERLAKQGDEQAAFELIHLRYKLEEYPWQQGYLPEQIYHMMSLLPYDHPAHTAPEYSCQFDLDGRLLEELQIPWYHCTISMKLPKADLVILQSSHPRGWLWQLRMIAIDTKSSRNTLVGALRFPKSNYKTALDIDALIRLLVPVEFIPPQSYVVDENLMPLELRAAFL